MLVEQPGAYGPNDEWVPGTQAEFPVWATLLSRDDAARVEQQEAGKRPDVHVTYRVRYNPAFLGNTQRLQIEIDRVKFNVTDVSETGPGGRMTGVTAPVGTRRRWLDIQAVESV